MPSSDFAAFILTNGRPDGVLTYDTLRRCGYTGRIVLLVDDLDKARDAYVRKYGDEVFVFDKRAAAAVTDSGDNRESLGSVLYARNASFDVAKSLGVRYFVQLDDDYENFQYRFDERFHYAPKVVRNLDRVFAAFLGFYKKAGVDSIAMAQGGDFIGGEEASLAQAVTLKRKCMNSFFCSTDRPFRFVARMNDDVTTYVLLGSQGRLFFTANQVNLNQLVTQSNPGGLTEMYLDAGTYVKSFYTVMFHPSSVRVGTIRGKSGATRLHHQIAWRYTVPMILREEVRKGPRPRLSQGGEAGHA